MLRYTCTNCDKKFNSLKHNRKYCSLKCYFNHRAYKYELKQRNLIIWRLIKMVLYISLSGIMIMGGYAFHKFIMTSKEVNNETQIHYRRDTQVINQVKNQSV